MIGLVGELGNIIEPNALSLRFITGWTGCVDKFFQKFQRFLAHVPRVHRVVNAVNARRCHHVSVSKVVCELS